MDPHELVDTRPILKDMDAMLFNNYRGREEFANLPRKLNVCVSSTRDDFPHTHINDVGFEAVRDPASGAVMFNVMVSGRHSKQARHCGAHRWACRHTRRGLHGSGHAPPLCASMLMVCSNLSCL